jgi:hypothetical protein
VANNCLSGLHFLPLLNQEHAVLHATQDIASSRLTLTVSL